MKSITVLMSVYNDAVFLKSSLKSVLNQSYRDFEFLIVDDGSTDNTEEVVNSFKDSRLNYKKIKHSGLASALNYGLTISGSEWIARIDADDLCAPERLKIQVEYLTKFPSCDVVSSWSVYFRDPGKILFFLKTPQSDIEIKKFLNLHNPINHSGVLFNRQKITDQGGYNEDFKTYEDFELWFRLRDKLKFSIIPEFLVYTRLRNDSMTKRENKKSVCNMLKDNAEFNFKNAETDEDKKYWNNILFWTEYFYGNKVNARKFITKDFSFKTAVAFLNTFLPDKAFDKISGLRIRYRLQSQFAGKKKYETELKGLLGA